MNILKAKLITIVSLASLLVSPVTSALVLSGNLAKVDYSGTITRYVDNTGSGMYDGVTSYSGSYLINSASTDLASSDPSLGFYKVNSAIAGFQSNSLTFGSDTSKMLIVNDYATSGHIIDGYFSRSSYTNSATNEKIVWGVTLIDLNATEFSDDAWIAEPVLANFDIARFFIRSIDLTTHAVNYMLKGNVTSLIDPPCTIGCNTAANLNLVRVPEPSTLFIFSLGLLALGFGFYAKSKK